MIRNIAVLIVVAVLAVFAFLNWTALSVMTPISFGWVTVQAPLGLLLLVPTLVLAVLFAVWALALQARVLRDVRNELVSAASARDDYGVVLDTVWRVDTAATIALRAALRERRGWSERPVVSR